MQMTPTPHQAWQPQGTAGIPRIDTPGEMGRALSSAMGR